MPTRPSPIDIEAEIASMKGRDAYLVSVLGFAVLVAPLGWCTAMVLLFGLAVR